MKKLLAIGSALALSVVMLPVVAQARNGADNIVSDVKQEDGLKDTTLGVLPQSNSVDSVSSSNVLPSTVLSNTTSVSDSNTTTVTDAVDSTSKDAAIALAKATFAQKTFKNVEQESEHGELVWEVKFTDGSRVEVSVLTGQITRMEDKANNNDDSNENHSDSDESSNHHNESEDSDDDR